MKTGIRAFSFLVSVIIVLLSCMPVAAAEVAPHAPAKLYITPVEGIEFVSLCSSFDFIGAVDSNGKVYLWDAQSRHLQDIPISLPPVKQLDIGDHHFIALDFEGSVHTWGSPVYGQCDFPDDLPPIEAIAADGYKSVLLTKDGKVLSFGDVNEGSQAFVPDMPKIAQIACSAYVTVAVAEDGAVFAWNLYFSEKPSVKAASAAAVCYDALVLDSEGVLHGDAKGGRDSDLAGDFLYKDAVKRENIVKVVTGGSYVATIDKDGGVDVWGVYSENVNAVVYVPENLPPILDAAFSHDSIVCLGADGNLYSWGATAGVLYLTPPASSPAYSANTVKIPDVCWNTVAYARNAIAGLPVSIVEIRELYAPKLTKGMVVGQWPLPGEITIPPDGGTIGLCLYISTDKANA